MGGSDEAFDGYVNIAGRRASQACHHTDSGACEAREIGAAASVQTVISCAAIQGIVVSAALQSVVVITTGQGVVAVTSF